MQYLLKFTGTFKNLKLIGAKFHKLYAMNYKTYSVPCEGGYKTDKFWVWVANGGYIEFNDFYSNTKGFIGALKNIDWSIVDYSNPKIWGEGVKKIILRFSHEYPERGFHLSQESFDMEIFCKTKERYGDKPTDEQRKLVYDEVRNYFDREIVLTNQRVAAILSTYEKIQNS